MSGDRIVLLHLSDIHFNRRVISTVHDPDHDVRMQLEKDAEWMVDRFDRIDAILVTGDIAYSGHNEEYDYAKEWLQGLADRVRCSLESVWTAPGNHDVDWKEAYNAGVQAIRKDLARLPEPEIDEKLRFYLMDEDTAGSLLLRPLGNYNKFAGNFGCEIKPSMPFWVKEVLLNDGSTLRVKGLNSTWLSQQNDRKGDMILGRTYALCPEEENIEYVTLCHHPIEWLLDQDDAYDALLNRARIMLFGHKHIQRYYQIDQTLRLTAGAVHPERRERQWLPRYNYLSLQVTGEGTDRVLNVRLYERIWSDKGRFKAEYDEAGSEAREFDLKLGRPRQAVRPSVLDRQKPVLEEIGVLSGEGGTNGSHKSEDASMHPARKLAQRFLKLPSYERIAIAKKLGLFEVEDVTLTDVEVSRQVFRRAKEKQIIDRLWAEVEQYYPDEEASRNPFASV